MADAKLSAGFRRYLIDLIVEWLSGLKGNEGAELTREKTISVLSYGQFTQTPSGVRYTPRQATLLPRRGLETNVLTVNGKRYVTAVGDTRKRQPGRVTPSRGGGAFPQLPLPFQPVVRDLAAWVSWHKYSVFGKYDELPGLLAIPHGPRLEVPPWFSGWDPNYDFEWEDFNPPRSLLPPGPEATIEAREGVQYIYGSQWMDPNSTEIPPWRMRRYAGKPMPMGLAYCMALVDGRLSIQSHPWTPWEGADGIGYRREADAPQNFLPAPRRAYGGDNLVVDELISPGAASGSVTFEGGLYSPSGEKNADGVYADLTPLFGSYTASFSAAYGVAVIPGITENILSLMYDNSDQEVDRRFRYIPFQPEFSGESTRFLSQPEQTVGTATYPVAYEAGAKYGPAFYRWNSVRPHPGIPGDIPDSAGGTRWGPVQADFVSTVLYFDDTNTPFGGLVGSRVLWSAFVSDPTLQSQGNTEAVVVSVGYGVELYPRRHLIADAYDQYGEVPNPPTYDYVTGSVVWARVTLDRPVVVSKQNGASMAYTPDIVSGDFYGLPTDDPAARSYGYDTYETYQPTQFGDDVELVTRTHQYITDWTPQLRSSPGYSPSISVEYGITFRGAFIVYAGVSGDEYSVYYEPGFEALTAMRANGGSNSQNRSAAPSGMNVLIRDEGSYSLVNGTAQYGVDQSPVGIGSLAVRSRMRDIPNLSDPLVSFTLGGSNSAERITGPGQKKRCNYFTAVGLQKRRKVTDPGHNHDGARPLDDPEAEATTYLMTEKKREIAAQTNPLLYRGEHGLLVNPFIKATDIGPENYFPAVGEDRTQALVQSWFGLTWPLGWYVADAAIIAIPNAGTGTPVDRTVAAVIYPAPMNARDDLDDYLLIISVDGVPIAQTWSVFDFFPGSVVTDPDTQQVTAREMFFLDGQRWPDTQRVNVKPNYNFLREGSGWPLRNTLWLEPFAMRLRNLKQDKFGPVDCPLTLFLDSVYVQD